MDAKFKRVKLSSLHEDPANARKHGPANRATVRASLKEFGQVEALVVERGTGRVIGGNCRLVELRGMGITEAWVAEVDMHDADAVRLGIVLNRSAELATWDDGLLSEAFHDLAGEGIDLANLGWSDAEVDALLAPPAGSHGGGDDGGGDVPAMSGTYAVLVTCTDERHQRSILEQLAEEGLECRAWNL